MSLSNADPVKNYSVSLTKICCWRQTGLKQINCLSTLKTKNPLFRSHRKLPRRWRTKSKITILICVILQVKSVKFLGIYITNQHITWIEHIKQITLK